MIRVGEGSAWIQGDAVCLGCGMVAELVGVPLVESGPHEICTSACREVLEKLCVRNDHLTARVKELQKMVKDNHPGAIPPAKGATAATTTTTSSTAADAAKARTSAAIEESKKSYSYTTPSAATATAPLRVPKTHADAAIQAGPKEFEVGHVVVVRDRDTEEWRKGEITKIEKDTKRPWVYVKGLGEMMWGHVEFVEKKPVVAAPAKPAAKTTAPAGTTTAKTTTPASTAAKTTTAAGSTAAKTAAPAGTAAARTTTGTAAPSATAAKTSTAAPSSSAAKAPATTAAKTTTSTAGGSAAAKTIDAKEDASKPAVGTGGLDLLDMSELQDMAKTITELKSKNDRLQSENTRLTRQLNTLTTEKATLNDKVLVAQNRAHQVDYLTDINTRQAKDLAGTKDEVQRLRRENNSLTKDLDHSRRHIDAVLGAEMSLDTTLACIVKRLQSIMQDGAQTNEARKMACVMSPDDFRGWLLAHDPHALKYQRHPKSPALASGNASQYLRKMRR